MSKNEIFVKFYHIFETLCSEFQNHFKHLKKGLKFIICYESVPEKRKKNLNFKLFVKFPRLKKKSNKFIFTVLKLCFLFRLLISEIIYIFKG